MIVTVTLNTGIDRTLRVPTFQWNTTIRAQEEAIGMGGKGIDAAWVLGELGIENLALGMAAGDTGRLMERLLQQRGVQTRFTWVEGDTRTNVIISSQAGEGQSTITANSLVVHPHHEEEFLATYHQALSKARCVILGGSIPPGIRADIYAELIHLAHQRAIPVILDVSGRQTLLTGLAAQPTLIKPNRVELAEIVQQPLNNLEEIFQAACQIRQQYGCSVVATLGPEGALAVTAEQAYFVEPLQVAIQSTAGAGDAVLAGLGHALAAGLPFMEGLRLGFAAAGAVMMTLATADCRRQDVFDLLPKVNIYPYPERQPACGTTTSRL